jgi:iron complex outermembrane recepter protein
MGSVVRDAAGSRVRGAPKITKLLLASASLGVLFAAVMPAGAMAQSAQPSASSTPLPPVIVENPRRQARAKPSRAVRTVRTAQPRIQRRPAPPAPTATVERGSGPVRGYVAGQSLTGSKTDTPILETPQSISVVTKDQIAAQQAQSVPEVVRYIPAVTTEFYGASSIADEVKVRGFIAPRYLDSLRLPYETVIQFAQTRTEPYNLERAEVLKGPASSIYGQSSPGGLLNMVSKRPTAERRGEIELQYGSFDRLQGAFDLSGPLDQDRQLLYRVVGVTRNTDKVIDFNHESRLFIAPSFTWTPNIDTTFTILSSFTRDKGDGQPQQYVPAYGSLYPNANGRIPYSRNIGEPNYDHFRVDQNLIGYSFEHRFNDVFQVRQNLRYGTVDLELTSMRNEAAFPDMTVTSRSANYVAATVGNLALDNQLQADFRTGPLAHKVLLGLDYQHADVFGDYRSAFPAPAGYPINIFAPAYGTPILGKDALTPFIRTRSAQDQIGVYVQDQIKLDRFVLTLASRHDNATANSTDELSGGKVNQTDNAWTGRAGLTYLFDNGVAPYLLYSTSFQPVAGFQLTDSSGNPFKPTTGRGIEGGVKYQPVGTKALFTAAVFEIVQQNVLTIDPGNPFLSVQTGEVRVRGAELEAKVSLTDRLDIVGGLAHIEPIVTKNNSGNIGKDVAVVPRDSASLWGMYTWRDGALAGFGLGAGVRYVGQLYGDEANTIPVPAHTLFDATIAYDFSYLRPELKGVKLQVNATNLLDTYYVTNCFTGLPYCALGAPRTVLATLKYQW